MKKGLMVMMALTLLLTLSFGQTADAKRGGGGGIKSPKQSYTQTPKKADNAAKTDTKSPTTNAGATKPGFFSGGGLMKGMMIGGLAGLMFGSMFAGMGGMGQFLGLMVNLIAIFALVMVIVAAIKYVRRKNTPTPRGPY
ncbi:MAG: hypothetical protein ACE3L7_05565 [Candidatus Pristimantibacillus sp.]